MLQRGMVTAFTISELLTENQRARGGGELPTSTHPD